jgi:hypothetical protein
VGPACGTCLWERALPANAPAQDSTGYPPTTNPAATPRPPTELPSPAQTKAWRSPAQHRHDVAQTEGAGGGVRCSGIKGQRRTQQNDPGHFAQGGYPGRAQASRSSERPLLSPHSGPLPPQHRTPQPLHFRHFQHSGTALATTLPDTPQGQQIAAQSSCGITRQNAAQQSQFHGQQSRHTIGVHGPFRSERDYPTGS